MFLLRAGTGHGIGTAILTDARVQATLGQAVTASGMVGVCELPVLELCYCRVIGWPADHEPGRGLSA